MIRRLAILTLALLCMAATCDIPELPKFYPKKKLDVKGAQLLITKVVVPPPAKTNIVLSWTWTANTNNPASNVVFVIRRLATNNIANPSLNWPVVAITPSNRWTNGIIKSARCVWFGVTASNKVTRLESGFSAR